MLSLEQFGAGPWGDHAARRSRRRGHQDRGPNRPRRRGPCRPAVPGRRKLAFLRELQPQQAQPRTRPAKAGGPDGPRRPRARLRRALLQPARRPASEASPALRRPEARESTSRVRVALGLRDDRAASERGCVRRDDSGPRGLDERHGRAGGSAHEERPLAGRLLCRLPRRSRRFSPASGGHAAKEWVGTRIFRSSRPLSAC